MKPLMTYRELLQILQGLSSEQLDQTVTIHKVDEDEFYHVAGDQLFAADEEEIDTLDHGHIYLEIC
jgi:hypothetical protein